MWWQITRNSIQIVYKKYCCNKDWKIQEWKIHELENITIIVTTNQQGYNVLICIKYKAFLYLYFWYLFIWKSTYILLLPLLLFLLPLLLLLHIFLVTIHTSDKKKILMKRWIKDISDIKPWWHLQNYNNHVLVINYHLSIHYNGKSICIFPTSTKILSSSMIPVNWIFIKKWFEITCYSGKQKVNRG